MLGEGALAGAEYVVPDAKIRDILADGLDLSGHIDSANANVGRAKSEAHDAKHVRKAGCVYAYAHVVVADRGFVDIGDWSVSAEP